MGGMAGQGEHSKQLRIVHFGWLWVNICHLFVGQPCVKLVCVCVW